MTRVAGRLSDAREVAAAMVWQEVCGAPIDRVWDRVRVDVTFRVRDQVWVPIRDIVSAAP